VQYFVGRKPSGPEDIQPKALRELLRACSVPEFEVGPFYAARFDSCRTDIMKLP